MKTTRRNFFALIAAAVAGHKLAMASMPTRWAKPDWFTPEQEREILRFADEENARFFTDGYVVRAPRNWGLSSDQQAWNAACDREIHRALVEFDAMYASVPRLHP